LFSFELNSHEKTTANQFSQFYTDDKEISANTSVKAKSRLNLNSCFQGMESHFMSLANIRDGALKKLTGGEGLLKMLWSKMLCNNGYFESAVENQIRMVTDLSSSSISHTLAIKCFVGLTTLMLQSTPSPRKSKYVCRLTTNPYLDIISAMVNST